MKRTPGYIRSIFNIAVLSVLLAACGSSRTGDTDGFGGISFKAVWPEQTGIASAPSKALYAAPAGVVTVRFIISGPNMSDMQADFPAAAGAGSVSGVPAGIGRSLTMQGLNGSNAVIYTGKVNFLTVTAGATTDGGTLYMKPVSPAAPPAVAQSLLTTQTTRSVPQALFTGITTAATASVVAYAWRETSPVTMNGTIVANYHAAATSPGMETIVATGEGLSDPKIAINNQNRLMIVWTQWNNIMEARDIYTRTYSGTSWQPVVQLTTSIKASSFQLVPAGNDFLLVFERYSSVANSYQIITQKWLNSTNSWDVNNYTIVSGLSSWPDVHLATSANTGVAGRSYVFVYEDGSGTIKFASSTTGTAWTTGSTGLSGAKPRIAANNAKYVATAANDMFSTVYSVFSTLTGTIWTWGSAGSPHYYTATDSAIEHDVISNATGTGFLSSVLIRNSSTFYSYINAALNNGSIWSSESTLLNYASNDASFSNLKLSSTGTGTNYAVTWHKLTNSMTSLANDIYASVYEGGAWAQPAQLAVSDYYVMMDSKAPVSIAGSGNRFIIAYSSFTASGGASMYTQTYDLSGSSWSGGSGANLISVPTNSWRSDDSDHQIITNQLGQTLAVWTRPRISYHPLNLGTRVADLYAMVHDGASWGAPFVLSSNALAVATNMELFPFMYILTSSNGYGFCVVWSESPTPDLSQVDAYASIFDGSTWSSPFKLSTGKVQQADLVSDGSGYALIYRVLPSGSTVGHIRTRVFRADTKTWDADTLIEDNIYSSGSYYIASDGTGYLAVWRQQIDSTSNGQGYIYASAYNGAWSAPQLVSDTIDSRSARLIAGASGKYLLAWFQGSGSTWNVYTREAVRSGATISWNTPVKISTTSSTIGSNDIRLAANGSGYAATWLRTDANNDNSLFASTFNGLSWSAETTLESGVLNVSSVTGRPLNPPALATRLVSNNTGTGYAAAWVHAEDVTGYEVLYASVFNGSSWSPTTKISTSTKRLGRLGMRGSSAGYALAWDEFDALPTWCSLTSSVICPATTRTSAWITTYTGSWSVNTQLGNTNAFSPVISSNGNKYSVLWSQPGDPSDPVVLDPWVYLGF